MTITDSLRVIHVVRDLDIASGGPSRSVPALASHQARTGGIRACVVYIDRGKPKVELTGGSVEFTALPGTHALAASLSALVHATGDAACLLHIHGLWHPLLHRTARFARMHELPYIVSTRGMLSDWALAHRRFRKAIAWRLYQRRDLANATRLIASSGFEERDVKAVLTNARVSVIPNGCAVSPMHIQVDTGLPEGTATRWALAIGRLHPIKGFAELIEAWARVAPRGWKLAIAGPDEGGYHESLEALVRSYRIGDQILFLGMVDDSRKWALLRRSELFVAPSRTENFGMAIAEALQSGTPVLTTTGTPWHELEERGCGWWVRPEISSLAGALREATIMPPQVLESMGASGQRLIIDNYSWERVADRSIELYRAVIGDHDASGGYG